MFCLHRKECPNNFDEYFPIKVCNVIEVENFSETALILDQKVEISNLM